MAAKAARQKSRSEMSNPELIKSAASNITESANDALAALVKLFNSEGRPGSGFTFDDATWARAKPLFISAAKKLKGFCGDLFERLNWRR